MSDYPGDLGCRWTIANSGPGPLTLSFASPFWLETGYTHCYDTLTITDTSTGDIVTLCGDEVTLELSRNIGEVSQCQEKALDESKSTY